MNVEDDEPSAINRSSTLEYQSYSTWLVREEEKEKRETHPEAVTTVSTPLTFPIPPEAIDAPPPDDDELELSNLPPPPPAASEEVLGALVFFLPRLKMLPPDFFPREEEARAGGGLSWNC